MGARGRLRAVAGTGGNRPRHGAQENEGFPAGLADRILVGTPRHHAGRHRLAVAAFDGTGRALTIAWLAFPAAEPARALALRLRLRAGRDWGRIPGPDAEAALCVLAMVEGVRLRHVDGEAPGTFEALAAHSRGEALDAPSLALLPAEVPVAACPEGGSWSRIASLDGALGAAASGMPELAARYARDLAFGGDESTDGRHYVLRMDRGGPVLAWVRIPGPDADPFELPEVMGPSGTDPFEAHAGRIAELGRAVDAMLGRRHCVASTPSGTARRGRRAPV